MDDDRDYADSIRDLIEMHTSWSVEVAYRATDAITKVQESRPAVVLLDLELPPLSGFVVAAALVETVDPAYQPVLWAISGNKDLVEAAARDERFRRALLKPVDFAAFMGELKDLQLLPDPVPGSDRKTSH